nr:S8 family serine peptidase [Candidatus Kapabacteria bacterium]
MNRLAVLLAVAVLCSSTLAAQPQILPADPPRRMDRVVADHLVVVFSASAVASTPLPELMRRNGFVEARPLLRFEQTVTSRLGMTLGGGVSARLLSLEEQLMRTYCVRTIPNGLQPEDQASKVMSACGDVETAEPWYVAELTGMELPNDTLAKDQELLSTLRMAETWAVQSGDTSVRIGISDSGVLQSHEDLKDNISVNIREVPDNGVDDDGNGYIDDYRGYNFASKDDSTAPGNTFNAREGHGTGTSGISSAVVNNVAGIAGVGGSCRFVPLKTMPDNRDGILYGYESIMYCAVNGIDVVNCSWGGFSRSCINERIVDYAFERGTIVVAAAGNHATTALFYPAAYREVLSVGVSEPDDSIAPMSGRGAFVDLMAPGNKTRTTSNSGGYGTFCCSSGASPIVAAAVGLLLSERPELRPRQAVALAR